MAMFRFLVPVLPCIYLLFQELLGVMWNSLGRVTRWVNAPIVLAMLAYTLLPSLQREQMRALGLPESVVEHYRKPPQMHGYADGVANERWHSNRLSLLGRFFRDFIDDPRESLLTNGIGAISYYSGMTVYGQHGLVDTHIAHLESSKLGKGLPGHEKGDYEYLLQKEPTYILVGRGFTQQELNWRALTNHYPEQLRDTYLIHYEVVTVPMVDERNDNSGFFSFLARKDRKQRLLEPRPAPRGDSSTDR